MNCHFLAIAICASLGSVAAESGILAEPDVDLLMEEDCDGGACEEEVTSLMQNHLALADTKKGAVVDAHASKSVTVDKKASVGDSVLLDANVADVKALSKANTVAVPSNPDPNGPISIEAGGGWMCLVIALLVGAGVVAGHVDPTKPDETNLYSQYLAEFIGTFMLIFSVGCNVLVGDGTWGVVAIACTLMVSIYALGGISGGNFNPAVSVCLGIAGKMKWAKVIVYVMVQLAAGVAAGLAYGVMLGKTFNLAPSDGSSAVQAGLAELLYTFMLTFVVLNTACSKAHAGKNQFYGLAIGFSVVAGGYSGGAISGGCFNPAVALGIDASSSAFGFGWCVYYWAFQFVGCAIAAILFAACRPGENDDQPEPSAPTLGSKLLSEFLGTYMLVLTVGLNVLAGSKAAVFSIAASLMCMIFALGSVSGANFNPAVTCAIALTGRGILSVQEIFTYIIVQLVGGLCAACTYTFLRNGNTVALEPSDSFSQAMVGETIFTFLLAYVVLCVATTKSPLSEYFGLAIGSCVTAGGLAIGSLSGGSLNPAVSVGLAFSHGGASIANSAAYAAAEIAGGVLAATIFCKTHHLEFETSK